MPVGYVPPSQRQIPMPSSVQISGMEVGLLKDDEIKLILLVVSSIVARFLNSSTPMNRCWQRFNASMISSAAVVMIFVLCLSCSSCDMKLILNDCFHKTVWAMGVFGFVERKFFSQISCKVN